MEHGVGGNMGKRGMGMRMDDLMNVELRLTMGDWGFCHMSLDLWLLFDFILILNF
jgi:hypothetical protein